MRLSVGSKRVGQTSESYKDLIPVDALKLIGPQYSILRPEFSKWREKSLSRRKGSQLKTILITMGGIDQHNMTGYVLSCLKKCNLPDDIKIKIVW